MRELDILGTYNTRDLGGYITQSNKIIKYCALIRSGNLDKLPKNSQQMIIQYGVQTVIDVRDEWEAEHYPNPFQGSEEVHYYNLPLIGNALSNDDNIQIYTRDYRDLDELYIKYIERCKSQIGQIISTIIDSEIGILIHCHAGKDRTGIITALILSVIGISDDDIANDYALSNQNIQHLIAEWRVYEQSKGRDMEQFERNNASKPETIITMLDYIRGTYGSLDDYLRHCGLNTQQLNDLKMKFLEK